MGELISGTRQSVSSDRISDGLDIDISGSGDCNTSALNSKDVSIDVTL